MLLALAAVVATAGQPCGCADRWIDRLSDANPAVRDVARTFLRGLGEDACAAVPARNDDCPRHRETAARLLASARE